MPHPLLDAFLGEVDRRGAARAPSGVRAAVARFGWTSRDLARELGVSERTARRYRQQDRIPGRRQDAWRDTTRRESQQRQRERIGRRGLSGLTAEGRYRVSKSVYETHPDLPVRALEPIPGSRMRDVFELADRGDLDAAEAELTGALGEAYGVGESMSWERVDSVSFTVR